MPQTINQAPINCIAFGVEHFFDKLMGDALVENEMAKHTITGGLGGFAQSFVCSPIELIKTHKQAIKEYAKLSDAAVFRVIYRKYGIRAGLYRGLGSTIYRDVPGFAAYFGIYEGCLHFIARLSQTNRNEVSYWNLALVGGSAGALSFAINYPVDLAKTQIQLDLKEPHQFKHTLDCLTKIFKKDGVKGLYKGLSSILLRAFVCNGIIFCVADFVKEKLSRRHEYHGL